MFMLAFPHGRRFRPPGLQKGAITMARTTRFAGAGALVPLIALIFASATPGARAQTTDEPVRVYTNADLALLGPLPAVAADPNPASRSSEEQSWKFVADFIKQERAKIDADRAYDLERERVDNEAREDRGHGVPYLGYYGYHPGPYHGRRHVHQPDRSRPPKTGIPHKMFRDRPPVREHVPGLGDSYRRGSARPAHGHRRVSH